MSSYTDRTATSGHHTLGPGGAPARERGHDGQQAVQGEQVHGRERAVDGERRLGKQPGGALEQAAALDAAVQVQERRAHEARLVAKVEQALRGSFIQAKLPLGDCMINT